LKGFLTGASTCFVGVIFEYSDSLIFALSCSKIRNQLLFEIENKFK